jgi:thermitase
VVGRDDKLGVYLLEFPDAAATDAALAQLQNYSDVQSVDYNYLYDPPPTPQLYTGAVPKIPTLNLDSSTPSDACTPIIGLIDTQFQPSGTPLDQFALPPISVVPTNCPPPAGITHATAMFETILSAVSQVSGGHSSVKILPVNVFDCSGSASTWNVVLGMQAAFNNGARVFSMSLGGPSYSADMAEMVNQLLGQGVVIFAAAGNQPVNTPTYPAAYPGVIAITALGAPGRLASYANYGSFVSMALPGASVVSLNNQSYIIQGTSPATAYAAGVAVGTKQINCASWSQIESGMQQQFPVPQGQQ